MRYWITAALLAAVGFGAAADDAMEAPAKASDSPLPECRDTEQTISLLELESAEQEVRSRLKISPSMDVQLENGVDPVEEARAMGLILEASIEEVEAALAAAQRTPDPADDIQALRLRHRGSYRFYPGPPISGTANEIPSQASPSDYKTDTP